MFFAFSLTPSLLPLPFLVQGALQGLAFAHGYGLGVAAVFLWNDLQLPLAGGRAALAAKVLAPRPTGSVVAGPSSFFVVDVSVDLLLDDVGMVDKGDDPKCPAVGRIGRDAGKKDMLRMSALCAAAVVYPGPLTDSSGSARDPESS